MADGKRKKKEFRVPRKKPVQKRDPEKSPLLLVEHQIDFDLDTIKDSPGKMVDSSVEVKFTNPTKHHMKVHIGFQSPTEEYLYDCGRTLVKADAESSGPFLPELDVEFEVEPDDIKEFELKSRIRPRKWEKPRVVFFIWHVRTEVKGVEYRVHDGEGQIRLN